MLELPAEHKITLSNTIEETILENMNEPMIYNLIDAANEAYSEIEPKLKKNLQKQQNQQNFHKTSDSDLFSEKSTFSTVSSAFLDLKNLTIHSDADIIIDRKSVFQAHVCGVKSKDEVERAQTYLYASSKKIAEATHNITAYRITREDGKINHDFDDDGEGGAGGRLAHLLEKMKVENVYVMVSRWYGGIHLGPDRFKHINNAAKNALVKYGFNK